MGFSNTLRQCCSLSWEKHSKRLSVPDCASGSGERILKEADLRKAASWNVRSDWRQVSLHLRTDSSAFFHSFRIDHRPEVVRTMDVRL